MTEPFSGSQLLKWGGTSVGAGLTFAVAAVETHPEMAQAITPDLQTSLYVLIFGAVAAALRAYVPSDKGVTARFDVLEAQFKSMQETLHTAASDAKSAATLTHTFRVELAGWMGGVDARLQALSERVKNFEERKS